MSGPDPFWLAVTWFHLGKVLTLIETYATRVRSSLKVESFNNKI